MAQITSGVGLISGLDSGAIINELLQLDEEPEVQLESQINTYTEQRNAYSTFSTDLTSMQGIANQLALPQTFQAATATSSDPNTLTATANEGAATGSYTFKVARLVSTQQSISTGFADSDTTPVGAGTITLEQGNAGLSNPTSLDNLNGGKGISRGQFRITDSSGNTAIVDTSDDVSLDDVVSQINSSDGVSVKASISDGGLVITDEAGGTGTLSIQDVNDSDAATSLGIAATAKKPQNVITGATINGISADTALSTLNDGNGVGTASSGSDFTITSGASTYNITLGSDATVGDVIKTIKTATGGAVTAAVSSTGNGLTLTSKGGPLSVTANNGSTAAADLGILKSGVGSITGNAVIAGLDSVLVSSLNGGAGLTLGTIKITDSSGKSANVNLAAATSVSDILGDINNAGLGVTASLNSSQTGIAITDTAGGTNNFTVSDVNPGTTATALGLSGSFAAGSTDSGVNLQKQYVSGSTLLSTLNGGKGINLGTFTITNSKGTQSTIDLSQGNYTNVGQVLNAINSAHAGVTASINSKGNGILLTDTAGGQDTMTVADTDGTSASDLNIAGSATAGKIDGAYQKTIAVSATDTLQDVESEINSLGFGVTANIVNDGSASDPYRLSITSTNSGTAGQVVIDSGTTGLNTRTLVQGQDAAVLYGGDGSSSPLMVTSSSNTITNLIKGVSVNLTGVSSSDVTLNISADPSSVASDLQTFVTTFNSMMTQLDTLSTYNTTTSTTGILMGDETSEQIQSTLYNALTSVVTDGGEYKTLADMGITIGSDALLSFDPDTFNTAFANDQNAVQELFSNAKTGLGNVLSGAITTLTDPVTGLITIESSTISTEITNANSNITQIAGLVSEKRSYLENEYANLETTLAGLQGQQAALGTISGASSAASSGSSSSNSGSSAASSANSGTSSSSGSSSSG